MFVTQSGIVAHDRIIYSSGQNVQFILARLLTVENDQMNLGVGQLSNTDRIAPKHFGRNLSWIIAGTKNDDPGAGDLRQQTFEIAIRRDQDQVVSGSVVQNPPIAGTSQPVSERALGLGEKVAQ